MSPATASATTLRPGLLVAVSTSIKGNVSYRKRELEAEQIDIEGTLKAKWETEKTIKDAAEHDAASKVRNRARNLIGSVCAATAFGFLCPESAAGELNKAISDARDLCAEFNAKANLSRVSFYVITGRVAPDDVEAVKAINSEVRQLLADMTAGVEKLDVKVIRDAADKAKQIGSMLSPDAQARITVAIEAARATAKKIKAAGETAAQEVDRRTLLALTEARTAFLDLEDGVELATPTTAARAVDFAPEVVTKAKPVKSPAPATRKLELD